MTCDIVSLQYKMDPVEICNFICMYTCMCKFFASWHTMKLFIHSLLSLTSRNILCERNISRKQHSEWKECMNFASSNNLLQHTKHSFWRHVCLGVINVFVVPTSMHRVSQAVRFTQINCISIIKHNIKAIVNIYATALL